MLRIIPVTLVSLERLVLSDIHDRQSASLIHRLVHFQLTSPLAYIIAKLYRDSPFSTIQMCENVYKKFHIYVNMELTKNIVRTNYVDITEYVY